MYFYGMNMDLNERIITTSYNHTFTDPKADPQEVFLVKVFRKYPANLQENTWKHMGVLV